MDKLSIAGEILTGHSIRPTRIRLYAYLCLEELGYAVTLAEIEAFLKKRGVKANTVTIFRTLKIFAEKRVVHSVRGYVSRFALRQTQQEAKESVHMHLYCRMCKETKCIDSLVFRYPKMKEVLLDDVSLFATGRCPSCLKKKTNRHR